MELNGSIRLDDRNGAAFDDVFRAGNGGGARRDEKGAEGRPFADYIPQRKAGVCTGASQRRFISSSSIDTVAEQPAMSSDVTKLPTSDRVTMLPAGSSNLRMAAYIRYSSESGVAPKPLINRMASPPARSPRSDVIA